jgi:hypothetical protein
VVVDGELIVKHGCRSRTGGGLARRAAGAAEAKAKEEAAEKRYGPA